MGAVELEPHESRVEEIFFAALDRPSAEERAAYLSVACGGDAGLRRRVERLLGAHPRMGGFLQAPAAVACSPTLPDSPIAEAPGDIIGSYKLLEQIGEGGFGIVFMAEQTAPVRRKVALKVLKPGMDTRQVIARFEAERQALAMMDHPNIARVLDAGATETGRPFFVMELVRGVPITEYCDRAELGLRERLDLFVAVCQAVQHAHQKGIIHRDIKPTNVLVTESDDRPLVKVIDFGIAKAISGQLGEKTVITGFAQVVGTPLYMSPEQAALSAVDIDTRSDIYSLGVLLYELLTGTTPFDRTRLQAAVLDEVRRIIREEEPEKPSTRLSSLGKTPPGPSATRRMEPRRLSRFVQGDLDWIVMKALEKDRERRYETASGFAADIQRYLADEPVTAGPPSAVYRLRKFARRNRGALVTAALVGAMLLTALGSFGWMALDRASRRGRNAEAVAALIERCEEALRAERADAAALALEAAERRAADGGAEGLTGRLARARAELTLLRELDAIDTFGWTLVEGGFPGGEAVRARWPIALAAHGVTADRGRAADSAERVKASLVRDRLMTTLHEWLTLEPSADVREGLRAVLRAADADPYREAFRDAILVQDGRTIVALAERPEALEQPAWFAVSIGKLAHVPEERRREVLESALRIRPGDLAILMSLGGSWDTGEPESLPQRIRWYQAAVAAHPRNVAARNNLGAALTDRGDLDGGIACFQEVVRMDPRFVYGLCNLAASLADKGETEAAIAMYREALRQSPRDNAIHDKLAVTLKGMGNPEGAMDVYRKAAQVHREAIQADPGSSTAHAKLGWALRNLGDPDGAIEAYEKAIQLRPDLLEAHLSLAGVLRHMKQDPGRATAVLENAVRIHSSSAEALTGIAQALRENGNVDGAIDACRKAIQADGEYFDAHMKLGAILCDVTRDYDGAAAAFQKAIGIEPGSALAQFNLGNALRGKGDRAGAIAACRKAIDLDPSYADAHVNLGFLLEGSETIEERIRLYRQAIELRPDHAVARSNLGIALWEKGNLDEAVAELERALELDPNGIARKALPHLLQSRGDLVGVAALHRKTIGIAPDDAEAHNNLAWLLATGPDDVRNGDQAVEYASRACELSAWEAPGYIDTLAAAHAEAGDFGKAVEYQKKALEFPAFEAADGEGGGKRLELYGERKAFRDPVFFTGKAGPTPEKEGESGDSG